jgi:outer membrane usher protein
LALCLMLAAPPAAIAQSAAPRFRELLVQVDVNQQRLDETVVVLEDAKGAHYVSERDLQRWRLELPAPEWLVPYQGESYYPLQALHSVAQRFDAAALTLEIDARADAFVETVRSTDRVALPVPQNSGPGGFFNYALFTSDAPQSQQRMGQFEVGYFNRYGVATTTLLLNHFTDQAAVTRLDSTWTRDFPQTRQTLRLGDAISSAGAWGRSVRFGGVQFGTNFATQPGFSSFATQSIEGEALLPSTVELFVNNALVSRQSVPPGPFQISNLPVVTGSGTVRMVVRDLFGREQLITQPFYASQALLRKGLSSYAFEAGSLRENYGVQSDDYTDWIASASLRRGLTDRLTGAARAEAVSGQLTAGIGGDYLVPRLGTLTVHAAASQGGFLTLLGVDRLTPTWSFGLRTQKTSAGFVQIGLPQPAIEPTLVSSASVSVALGRWGSLGLAAIHQSQPAQPETRLLSASYSVGLGRGATMGVSLLAALGDAQVTQLLLMLSLPLGPVVQLSTTAQAVRTGDGTSRDTTSAVVQRNLPSGSGYGYRLQARSDGASEAALALQNDVGSYSLAVAQTESVTATQLSLEGGLAWLSGSVFASRQIGQSFAVARVPDYPGVRVLADNQPVGRTDAHGNALIASLRAFDANVISVDQRDLPMDAVIGALSVVAVPYFRSGVEALFPIQHAHSATLTLVLEDGEPMPAGASVTLEGQLDETLVGTGGEVYLLGLLPRNVLHVEWHDRACVLEVPYAPGDDPLPDLGRFVCKGVLR